MVQFDLLPFPTGNSRDKSSPSDPGLRNSLKRSFLRGRGWGKQKNCLLFDFAMYVSFLDGCGPQDYVFLRKNAGICRRVVGEE